MGEPAQDIGPKILGRDDILGSDDLPRELVEVPEWGGSVWVRTMTGQERDAYEASIIDVTMDSKGRSSVERRMENSRAKLLTRCICGDDGERIFTESDVAALGRKSAKALDRVFDVAQRLNGMTEEDLEELAGN